MKEKRCTRCMFKLPVEEFRKNRKGPGGYSWWCKICHRDYDLETKAKERRRVNG